MGPLDWNRADPELAPAQDLGPAPKTGLCGAVQGCVVRLPTHSAGGQTEASSTWRSPSLYARGSVRM